MNSNDRFIRSYTQGVLSGMEIWVDRETGVNYLCRVNGYAGGMTVLVDKDGKPVVTDPYTLAHDRP